MENITIEVLNEDEIETCRDLCNELMAFQKSKAILSPKSFDEMNFDTRMKRSYEGALHKQVVVVKDKGVAVGYVFSTIDMVDESARNAFPGWAPKGDGNCQTIGFYPNWVKLPQKIGCLSNLYLREPYKGLGLGGKLTDIAMKWLASFSDCTLSFVFISNGNDKALEFYKQKGFVYSHEVFNGFIKAAYIGTNL